MHNLLVSLVAIAALDSLNPTATALQIYLLSTPRPVARSTAFICGIFLAYWTAGLVIILGLWQSIVTTFSSMNITLPETWLYWMQLVLGVVLLMVGFTLKASSQSSHQKPPQKLTADRTFLLGMAVTLWEFPTALPYLVALEQITRAKLDLISIMSVLGLYTSIFVLPLIVLLSIYLIFHQQSAELLQRINRSIAIWSPRILRVLLIGLGFVLVVDSIAYTFGHSFLKLS